MKKLSYTQFSNACGNDIDDLPEDLKSKLSQTLWWEITGDLSRFCVRTRAFASDTTGATKEQLQEAWLEETNKAVEEAWNAQPDLCRRIAEDASPLLAQDSTWAQLSVAEKENLIDRFVKNGVRERDAFLADWRQLIIQHGIPGLLHLERTSQQFIKQSGRPAFTIPLLDNCYTEVVSKIQAPQYISHEDISSLEMSIKMESDEGTRTHFSLIAASKSLEARITGASAIDFSETPHATLECLLPNKHIQTLDLRNHNATYLPEAIFQMSEITTLLLDNSQIQNLDGIDRLPNIQTLSAKDISLRELPDAIAKLPNLRTLDLRGCDGLEIPPELLTALGELDNLTTIGLPENVDENKLPHKLKQKRILLPLIPEIFDLTSRNQALNLSSQPIGDLSRDEVIRQLQRYIEKKPKAPWARRDIAAHRVLKAFDDGKAGDPFPEEMRALNLSNLGLDEEPPCLDQLRHIRKVDLSSNCLRAVGNSVCRMNWLEELNINENFIRRLDDAMANLTALQCFYANHNMLSRIDALASLPSLTDVEVSGNQLTWTAFNALGQLKALTYLNIAQNKIDSLPPATFQLTKLQTLILSHNFVKEIPEDVSRLSMLHTLNASFNRITRLPDTLWDLTRLSRLEVEHNKLTDLPRLREPLQSLRSVYLNGNQLQYLDPSIGDHLPSLDAFHVNDNKLREIPESIEKLFDLRELHLSRNPIIRLDFLRSLHMKCEIEAMDMPAISESAMRGFQASFRKEGKKNRREARKAHEEGNPAPPLCGPRLIFSQGNPPADPSDSVEEAVDKWFNPDKWPDDWETDTESEISDDISDMDIDDEHEASADAPELELDSDQEMSSDDISDSDLNSSDQEMRDGEDLQSERDASSEHSSDSERKLEDMHPVAQAWRQYENEESIQAVIDLLDKLRESSMKEDPTYRMQVQQVLETVAESDKQGRTADGLKLEDVGPDDSREKLISTAISIAAQTMGTCTDLALLGLIRIEMQCLRHNGIAQGLPVDELVELSDELHIPVTTMEAGKERATREILLHEKKKKKNPMQQEPTPDDVEIILVDMIDGCKEFGDPKGTPLGMTFEAEGRRLQQDDNYLPMIVELVEALRVEDDIGAGLAFEPYLRKKHELKPSAPCPEWRTRTQLMMEWNALKRQLMAHPKIADGFQELDKELDALIVGWEPDPAERKKDPYQQKLNSEKAWETRVKALSEKTAHRDLLAKLIPRFRAWGDWREAYNLSPDALPISKRITAQFVADAEKRNIRVPIKRDQARKIFEEWSQNSVSQEYSSADKQAAFEKFCDVGFRRIGPEIQEHRQALAKAKEAAGARLPDFEIIQRTGLPVEHKKNRDTKIHPLDQSNGITTFGLSYSEDPVKQVVVLSLTAEQLRQTRLSKAQIEQLDGMIAENKARAASSPSRFITLHMLEKNSLQIIPEGSAQHQVPSPKRGGR